MASAIDIYVAYKFIRQLATPWEEWEAFELGLIDDKGQKLKSVKTPEERRAYPKWKILIRNIKRLLDKIPFGRTRLGSFAAALWLVKEEMKVQDITILEKEFNKYLKDRQILVESDIPTSEPVLLAGRYKTHDGIVIHAKESKPIGEVFGISIFEIIDRINSNRYIVTKEDLECF